MSRLYLSTHVSVSVCVCSRLKPSFLLPHPAVHFASVIGRWVYAFQLYNLAEKQLMDVMSNQKGKKKGGKTETQEGIRLRIWPRKLGTTGGNAYNWQFSSPPRCVCVCVCCLCFVACPLQGFYGHVSVLSEQPDSTQLNWSQPPTHPPFPPLHIACDPHKSLAGGGEG